MVAFWTGIGNVPEEAVWVRTTCWIADHEESVRPDAGGAGR